MRNNVDKYSSTLNEWNAIIAKEIYHLFNVDIPKDGDDITFDEKNYTIIKVVDDEETYFIKWIKTEVI